MTELKNTKGIEEYIKNAETHSDLAVELISARLTTDEEFEHYIIGQYLKLRKGELTARLPEFNHGAKNQAIAMNISEESFKDYTDMFEEIRVSEEEFSEGVEKICLAALKDIDILKIISMSAIGFEGLKEQIRSLKVASQLMLALLENDEEFKTSFKRIWEVVIALLKTISDIVV